MTQRWVLASSNAGKLREFTHALAPVLDSQGIALVSQSDLGIAGADEPHPSFEANALAKARHASRASGLPALADDSGLCVDVLEGAPGVRSARFCADAKAAGQVDAPTALQYSDVSVDEANLRWLIARLKALNAFATNQTMAHYCAAIAFVRSADDPAPAVVVGRWHGRIVESPRGSNGFGYDPVFFDSTMDCTAAEMTIAQKQSVSHRGKALRALLGTIV